MHHLVKGFVDYLFGWCIHQPFKGMVHLEDCQVRVQDEDPVRDRAEQSRHAQVLAGDLGVEPGITHSNGCLVGKAVQNGVIVSRETGAVVAENKDLPNRTVLDGHSNADARDHAHADIAQHAVDLWNTCFCALPTLADARQPGLKVTQ